jgi:hypothetical protein
VFYAEPPFSSVVKTTYRDLGEEGHYEITVRVRNCSEANVENRAYELSVEDIEGTRFQFIVWESSEQGRDYNWEEGSWYRLSGVTANKWPSGTVPHGTSSLGIEYLGSQRDGGQAQILYLTDTHLGKTTHSYKGKSWAVSPEQGFRTAINRAISKNVDAVIHGGDLFHNPGDGITEKEISVCRECLTSLAEAGIPFYFIYGNHERQAGRRVMERFVDESLAVHLGPRYEMIENALALYGIDHRSEWSDFVLDLESPPEEAETMLCVHQSIAPFTESKDPDCSLEGLRAAANIPMDLIVTGHVHNRSECDLGEFRGLSGGATTRVGETRDDLHPSVELISTEEGQIEFQQQFL